MAAQMTASKIEGLEDDMIQTLKVLKAARESLQKVKDGTGNTEPSRYEITPLGVYVTRGELLKVMEARVAEFEARARELGIFGPAAKAEKGDGLMISHSRGGLGAVTHD